MDQNFCLDGQANPDHDTLLVKFSELVEFGVGKVFMDGNLAEVRKMFKLFFVITISLNMKIDPDFFNFITDINRRSAGVG